MDTQEALRQELIRQATEHINEDYQASLIKLQNEEHDRNNKEYNLWSVETVKHIALISLAGLAGVFALMTGNKVGQTEAFWSALSFACGSVLSTLSMYFAMKDRWHAMEQCNTLLRRIYAKDFPKPEEYERSRKVKAMGVLSEVTGWSGAICVLGGGIYLFTLLAD